MVLSQKSPSTTKGTLERIKVHGKSLEGNLEGETADPDVSIYFPPRYETNRNRRYPVIYLLHGYGLTDQYWTGLSNIVAGVNVPEAIGVNVPEAMDKDIAAGLAGEMIVVMPNAYTKYAGSMYSSSVTTGDWEAYIADDLVSYMDKNYRTIPNRMSRGIAGHSMGGYGAIRIAMKRPDVFSSMYNLSACCLLNDPVPQQEGTRGEGARRNPIFAKVNQALAAAWSPNPKNPPDYFDMPVKEGRAQPLVVAKWYANAPLAMADQYATNLKKFHALAGDVGLQDNLITTNKQLEEVLINLGIAYK